MALPGLGTMRFGLRSKSVEKVEDKTKRWIYEHNDVLQRLYPSYDQMEYFCLPISEMDYYNLSPTPPVLQHFDLMAGEVTSNLI